MKMISPNFEIMMLTSDKTAIASPLNPMVHIEKVGRICYKSEDMITAQSAPKFVKMLYDNNHMAMLEHYRFIMEVNPIVYEALLKIRPKYITMTRFGRCVISFSARGLVEIMDHIVPDDTLTLPLEAIEGIREELIMHCIREYQCPELFGKPADWVYPLSTGADFLSQADLTRNEYIDHGWMSVLFTVDRGISHEIVRHRDASFAQESTRYCNYSRSKFGREIVVVDTESIPIKSEAYKIWKNQCKSAEDTYIELIEGGSSAQEARSVLPTCLKTSIVMTANTKEWLHFFDLRALGKTGKPHPMMQNIAMKLYKTYCSYRAGEAVTRGR